MKIKPTFFNTRHERLHWNYFDINNYMFTIFFKSGKNMSFILRDLKKNENIKNYIYNKLLTKYKNIVEIDISNISNIEYNLMKLENIPCVIKIC